MPKQSGPEELAPGSTFPHIEAVLDARDAIRVNKLFSTSVDKLNGLLAAPTKGKGANRDKVEKVLKSYELTALLLNHLFTVKGQLEDKTRSRP